MKIILAIALIPILIIIGVESGVLTNTFALNNNNSSSIDFAAVETLGKSYTFGLDYTILLNKTQIVKSDIADDDVINASRRTPVRGAFYSTDRDSIEDFDAFLIKEHRIKVNYVNGTIDFNNQHHLINLECNFNYTGDGCHTFYGEFPYREQPTQYMLVLAAYFDDYVKYYITKVNLS
jgi:hypothetical protein